MNEEILLDAMNEISDEHIAEAVSYEKKTRISFRRIIPVAACIVFAVTACFATVRLTVDDPTKIAPELTNTNASIIVTQATNPPTTAAYAPTTEPATYTEAPLTAAPEAPAFTSEVTSAAGVPDTTVAGVPPAAPSEAQTTVACPTTVKWENAPYSYCYREFSFGGINYINYSGALTGEESLGEVLGSAVLTSADDEGKMHSVNADVYEIKGVSQKCVVALYFKDGARMKTCAQGYYVYYNRHYTPETLGQAMDEMNFKDKMLIGQSDIYIYYDAETDDGKVVSQIYLVNERAINAFNELLENNKNLKGESFDRDAMIRSQNLTIGASYLGAWTEFRLNSDGYLYFGLGDNELQYNIGKQAFNEFLKVIESECQFENSTMPALAPTTTSQVAETAVDSFPRITKATLYIDGVSEDIDLDDSRLQKMTNYIMKAYNEHNYPDVAGELEQSQIDDYYKSKAKAYMELELESDADNVFHRYNKAVIAYADVIMIDDDSVSYHEDGNPFNFTFSPYNTGGVPVAPILYICEFTNSSLPYRDS